ncbi:MAG: type II toxin-antitoxin system RelB/DinJ family antitoxin [Dehalococcoidia bacterium]
MTNKSAVISARIDPEIKNNAERVFKELGLTTSQAITLFYKQVDIQHGLPFEVKIPNKATLKAMDDAETRNNLQSFNNVEDLFDDLEN